MCHSAQSGLLCRWFEDFEKVPSENTRASFVGAHGQFSCLFLCLLSGLAFYAGTCLSATGLGFPDTVENTPLLGVHVSSP